MQNLSYFIQNVYAQRLVQYKEIEEGFFVCFFFLVISDRHFICIMQLTSVIYLAITFNLCLIVDTNEDAVKHICISIEKYVKFQTVN